MTEQRNNYIDAGTMPFLKHLEELRRVLVICLVAIGIASIASFFFVDKILVIITKPLYDLGIKLVFTSMTEGIFTKFKIALLAGIVLAAPVIIWQFWRFIIPALYPHEKRYVYRLVPLSIVLFVSGVMFAYFTVFKIAIFFLIKLSGEFQPMLTISRYFSFVLTFLIPFGLIFEFPLVVYFLASIGIITPEWLKRKRKYAIVLIFILAAVFTPSPDPLSQIIMAAPMLVLYEAGILVASVVSKKRGAKFNELSGEES